jgi:hypothetical protein
MIMPSCSFTPSLELTFKPLHPSLVGPSPRSKTGLIWVRTPLVGGWLFVCFSGRAILLFPMDASHILFWNVRGLNSAARPDAVWTIVSSAKVDVVCLQETKKSHFDRWHALSMLGSKFDNNFVFLPSIGASGGIFISWRSRLGSVAASRVDSYSTTVQFSPENGDAWWLLWF